MTDKDKIKFAIRYLKQGLKSKRTSPLYEELMKELGFEKKYKVQELEKENAGLKAGRPEWHDLRKDPNDLPKSYMSVVNQDGVKVMYDYSCKAWRYDDADNYYCDTPIAWCEIPTFTDKE